MQKLDSRLSLAAQMCGNCCCAVDVGCDHGFLSSYLLLSDLAKRVIACDINPMPLQKARNLINSLNLSDRCSLLLTDGLKGIDAAAEKVDRVVIAGMGGELIYDIISAWEHSRNKNIVFILQPMTKAERLRKLLWENGFDIREERCCVAAGRPYSVMSVSFSGPAFSPDEMLCLTGNIDPASDPFARYYLDAIKNQLIKKTDGLKSARPDSETHLQLLKTQELLNMVENKYYGDEQHV